MPGSFASETDNTVPASSSVPDFCPWAVDQDTERAAAIWGGHAAERLADWANGCLVVRHDAYGRYRSLAEMQAKPDREPVTIEKRHLHITNIRRHFRPLGREHIIGPLTTDLDNLCRALSWDIDKHDKTRGKLATGCEPSSYPQPADPVANCRYAIRLYDQLCTMGYRPLLLDSNGVGGFHLYLILQGFWPARALRSFGLWMVRDWADHGLVSMPEVFPKQDFLRGAMVGNWMRLPGKHHTRDHWSRAWTGDRWNDTPYMLFEQVGNWFTMPEEALFYSGKYSGGPVDRENIVLPQTAPIDPSPDIKDLAFTIALAKDALAHYKNKDLDYEQWFKVAASLACLGMDGLVLWLDWSATSIKHDEEYCLTKWASLRDDGRRGLGSLFVDAEEAGWDRAARAKVIGRRLRDKQARERVKAAMEASRKK